MLLKAVSIAVIITTSTLHTSHGTLYVAAKRVDPQRVLVVWIDVPGDLSDRRESHAEPFDEEHVTEHAVRMFERPRRRHVPTRNTALKRQLALPFHALPLLVVTIWPSDCSCALFIRQPTLLNWHHRGATILLLSSIHCFVHIMRRLQLLRAWFDEQMLLLLLFLLLLSVVLSGVVLVVPLKTVENVYNDKTTTVKVDFSSQATCDYCNTAKGQRPNG